MNEQLFRAMGSEIAIISDCPESQLEYIPAWFEAWEAILSRFRPTSELMLLNQRPHEWVEVSTVLWDVMQLALAAAHISDGIVVPTVLPALINAGYDRSFEHVTASDSAHEQPIKLGDWRMIRTDQQRIWLPADVQLDLGGVGKSWAAQRTLDYLQGVHGLVDVGGDIAVKGGTPNGDPWLIEVQNPFDPDGVITTIELATGGVATSGRDYRTWTHNGKPQHHLIDPRTGSPANTDVMSVTVIASSVIEAEIAAKATLILGSAAGLDWLHRQDVWDWIIVRDDGDVMES